MPTTVIVFGAGGHAVSVAETVLASGQSIDCFVDETSGSDQLLGCPVLSSMPGDFAATTGSIVIAVGDNSARQAVWTRLTERYGLGCFPTLIHPSASVSQLAVLAPGSVVLQGAIVGSKATVGLCCLLNSGSILEHEAQLGDFASLAPGSMTGGRVSIGARTAVGIGAVIKHGVAIGHDSVIGANSYVTKDLPSDVVAYGTPARIIRSRAAGDSYLH